MKVLYRENLNTIRRKINMQKKIAIKPLKTLDVRRGGLKRSARASIVITATRLLFHYVYIRIYIAAAAAPTANPFISVKLSIKNMIRRAL